MEHRVAVARHVLPSLARASAAAAVRVREAACAAVRARGRFDWVVAGGHTPEGLYRQLAGRARGPFPWAPTWVYFGDERAVGPRSLESNYAMVRESLLRHVPIPRRQVVRLRGEMRPLDAAARAYARALEETRAGEDGPRFDLVLLGLGPDGHTASLFPDAAELAERRRAVVGVPRAGHAPYVARLTLTLPALSDAREVLFLVAGADKAPAVARTFRAYPGGSPRSPASLVRPVGTVHWFLDRAAAADLGRRSAR